MQTSAQPPGSLARMLMQTAAEGGFSWSQVPDWIVAAGVVWSIVYSVREARAQAADRKHDLEREAQRHREQLAALRRERLVAAYPDWSIQCFRLYISTSKTGRDVARNLGISQVAALHSMHTRALQIRLDENTGWAKEVQRISEALLVWDGEQEEVGIALVRQATDLIEERIKGLQRTPEPGASS